MQGRGWGSGLGMTGASGFNLAEIIYSYPAIQSVGFKNLRVALTGGGGWVCVNA